MRNSFFFWGQEKALEELAVGHCGLTLEDVKCVAEELPFTSLRSLELAGNELRSAGLEVT